YRANESHFTLDSTNLTTAKVGGTYKVSDLNPGFVGGAMAIVPEEWRSVLGAPALTGLGAVAIIGRSSMGPAAFGFDPNTLGQSPVTPVTPYVYYPSSHPTLGDYTSNPPAMYNGTANGFSPVFVPETRSVLVFGRMGTGEFAYQG